MTCLALKGQLFRGIVGILRGIIDGIREILVADFTDETRIVQVVNFAVASRSVLGDQIRGLELFSTSLAPRVTNVRRHRLEIGLDLRVAFDAVEMSSVGKEQRAIERRLTLIAAKTSRMEDAFAVDQGDLLDDLQTMKTHRG